jgi:hypothetical protein
VTIERNTSVWVVLLPAVLVFVASTITEDLFKVFSGEKAAALPRSSKTARDDLIVV